MILTPDPEILPPTDDFVRLCGHYDEVSVMGVTELASFLVGFPGLTPREVVWAMAMWTMSRACSVTGLRMLESLADGDELVCAYARTILATEQ